MVYTDAHRFFLQILTARRLILAPEVKNTYEKCCARFNVPSDNLQEFIQEINQELEAMHLRIRKSVQEDTATDTQCFVIINLLSGEATRMASTLSQQELALFRCIIEKIVQSDDGQIPEMEAINIGTFLEPRMKTGDCEEVVERLVQEKWLLLHIQEERMLSLSALTASELQVYLEESYPESVHKCFFCKILTIKGHSCTKCSTAVHRKCGLKFWTHQNSQSPVCPDCGETWSHVEVNLPQKRQKLKS
ncbi:non-structural maintenance of chromosomes element 1 homolog [Panulirus ornatus]|uniref:non-structural maintenance of chromosomes element 1 homolog n=1 Tax=Panulirus ornatus TaxID=150431 RepID=UPI003A838883